MENAAKWKDKLEVAQRKRRKAHEEAGTDHKPAYFVEDVHPLTNMPYWRFTGEYWKDREKKDWSKLIHIFEE
jgi:oxysterol-binding protein 1